ncbi:MAG TPA: glycine oxidase ThiO [Myxococcaceae bacterium]|nr:glycine oxidase ThiO [Myxococcaceae bacterium]
MEVLIVGAGVVGCAVAWRLQQSGARCTVLERSIPGAEASSAAGGILAPQAEADGPGPFLDLCLASRALYPTFARELREVSDVDVGFRECGVLEVTFDGAETEAMRRRIGWQSARGLEAAWLDSSGARALEPELSPRIEGAAHFPGDAVVDNRLLVPALTIAGVRAGARFLTAQVHGLLERGGQVVGVATDQGELRGDAVVVAAGAWTALVPGALASPEAVRPARGQMVMVRTRVPICRHVVFGARGYVVPRTDGRLLLGSTVEFAGFEKQVTVAGLSSVLGVGMRLFPGLSGAPVVETWAGFRPHTPDGLPVLGPGSLPGLFLASGHFRNGILLTPITANVLTDTILGRTSSIDLTPFRVDRKALTL